MDCPWTVFFWLEAGRVGLLVEQFHGATDIILKPLEVVLSSLTGP